MLDSDAPKAIGDNVYIPQDRQRKVNESEEASDEGGSFSFVFYDQNGKNRKGQQKKQPVDIGDPVKLNLSQTAKPQQSDSPEKKTEEEEDNADEKKPLSDSDGHINITV